MRINLLKNHEDSCPKPLDLDWNELVEMLRQPLDLDPKGMLPAWIPAHLEDQLRGSQHARAVGVLVLDYDDMNVGDWNQALENLQSAGVEHCWHSTRSHKPVDGSMGYRVVVRLSREVDGQKWKDFYKASAVAFGGKNDGKTCDPSRLFYLPVQTPHFEFGHAEGSPWPVDVVFEHLASEVRGESKASRTSLERLCSTGKDAHDFDELGHETLRRLLDSTKGPYADEGNQDNALFACACWLSKRMRPCDPQSIVDVCMPAIGLPGGRHADGRTFYDKLERAFLEAEAVLKDSDPVDMCQLNREGPYTDEEIQRYIGEQNLQGVEYLKKQMLLTHRSNVYVFTKGDYIYAGSLETGEALATQELLLAKTLGVELQILGPAGLKEVPFKTLRKRYGCAIRTVAPSLAIRTSYIDWPTSTLWHAICPRRLDLVPAEDPAVQEWLESWGDDTLLDWLATAPKLNKATAALFLHGPKEGGKSMLARGLAAIWGKPPTKMQNLGLNFNDAITKNPVVLADESLPEHFRKDSGLLRELITAECVSLNRKYMEPVDLHGSVRIVIAKNNMNLFGPESMSRDDVEAVCDRLLYYRLHSKAPYFNPIRLAQHILYLEATRDVHEAQNARLWVRGRDSALHRHMRISSRDRSLVCQWLMDMLINPNPVRDAPHTTLNLRQGVSVTPMLVYRRWDVYLGKEKQLGMHQIAQVLGELGVKNQRGLYEINLDDLRQWADAHSYPTDVDNLVAMAHTSISRGAN